MIQLVALGVLLFAVAINSSPVGTKNPDINIATEARRLVHQANWASVGTISTDASIKGYPIVTLLSTADSKVGAASTGDIFFYMLESDLSALDIKADNRISFMFSDAQEGECNKKGADPWSHECPRTIISGQVKKLEKDTDEYNRGLEAFLSRHPTANTWDSPPIPGHKFFLCKLDISNVLYFGGYGGYKRISRQEYFDGTDSIDPNNA